jgi:ZIP family zinc transporter
MTGPAGAGGFAGPLLPPVVIAGFALIAAATLAGAFLALRGRGPREAWLGAAAGALLVIALLHLLPDAWSAAGAARIWPGIVPAAALSSLALSGLAARRGCACDSPDRRAGGGTVAALAVHRFLEGSALALAASITVTAALAVHALAEGVAAGTLLAGQSRRRVRGMLAVMCLSPAAGAIAAGSYRLPAAATPVLLALAAGILAQAAWLGLAAITRQPSGWRLAPHTAAVVLAAAAVTAMAVRAVG